MIRRILDNARTFARCNESDIYITLECKRYLTNGLIELIEDERPSILSTLQDEVLEIIRISTDIQRFLDSQSIINLDSYPELYIAGEIFSKLEESDDLLARKLGQPSKSITRLPIQSI